jgi:hypothetical protein
MRIAIARENALLERRDSDVQTRRERVMAKNIADLLVDTLVAAGVKKVYGVAGDSLNAITDSIRKHKTTARPNGLTVLQTGLSRGFNCLYSLYSDGRGATLDGFKLRELFVRPQAADHRSCLTPATTGAWGGVR